MGARHRNYRAEAQGSQSASRACIVLKVRFHATSNDDGPPSQGGDGLHHGSSVLRRRRRPTRRPLVPGDGGEQRSRGPLDLSAVSPCCSESTWHPRSRMASGCLAAMKTPVFVILPTGIGEATSCHPDALARAAAPGSDSLVSPAFWPRNTSTPAASAAASVRSRRPWLPSPSGYRGHGWVGLRPPLSSVSSPALPCGLSRRLAELQLGEGGSDWALAVGVGNLRLVLLGRRAWVRGFPDPHTPIRSRRGDVVPDGRLRVAGLVAGIGPCGSCCDSNSETPFSRLPGSPSRTSRLLPGTQRPQSPPSCVLWQQ